MTSRWKPSRRYIAQVPSGTASHFPGQHSLGQRLEVASLEDRGIKFPISEDFQSPFHRGNPCILACSFLFLPPYFFQSPFHRGNPCIDRFMSRPNAG